MEEIKFRLGTFFSEIQRPNDAGTVQYAQYDVVGSMNGTTPVIGTLSDVSRYAGGYGYITQAKLAKNGTLGAGSNTSFRVHLYGAPPTGIADNSPCALLYGTFNHRLTYFDFNLQAGGVGCDMAYDQITEVLRKFWTKPTSTDLYWILELRSTAYLAPASEKYTFEITAERY